MFSNIFLQFENLTWIFSSPSGKCPVKAFNTFAGNALTFIPAETLVFVFGSLAYVSRSAYCFFTRKTLPLFVSTALSFNLGRSTYSLVVNPRVIFRKKAFSFPTMFSKTQLLAMETSRFILRALVKNKVPLSIAVYFVMPLGTILWVVLLSNNIGMLPFAFALTSQLSAALTCSALIYFTSLLLSIQIRGYSLVNSFLPAGTPVALYPVLIVIEIVSHASRFISLGVRLAANILAGHLLVKVFAMGVNYVMLCMTANHPNRAHIYNNIFRYAIEHAQMQSNTVFYTEHIKLKSWLGSPEHKSLKERTFLLKGIGDTRKTNPAYFLYKDFINSNKPEVFFRHGFRALNKPRNKGVRHEFEEPYPRHVMDYIFRFRPWYESMLPSARKFHIHLPPTAGNYGPTSVVWNRAARNNPFNQSQRYLANNILALRAKQLNYKRGEWNVIISSVALLVIGLGFLLPIVIMETAVASLQAYVFFHLSSMYISEAITAKH